MIVVAITIDSILEAKNPQDLHLLRRVYKAIGRERIMAFFDEEVSKLSLCKTPDSI